MDLDKIYRHHPLREETILARLAAHHIPVDRLSEWDLAIDPDTNITDQNHSGGVQSVFELAVSARITAQSRVADIGAGLGGSARTLAQAFGCSVMAYEQDAGRCADAESLTKRAGLSHLVRVVPGDALSAFVIPSTVDVLWGQAAWIHFADPAALLKTWIPSLRPGGTVAIADAFLARPPEKEGERSLVSDLAQAWGGYLRPLDEWINLLRDFGFSSFRRFDRTAQSNMSFRQLVAAAVKWPAGAASDEETASWRLALKAYDSGLVCNQQLIAMRAL
jgi:SAM-dependent methyltransferase